VSTIVRQL